MKRMLSAIKPTGQLTLGNYIGALKNFVKYQNSGNYEMFLFIANLHCITDYQEPKELRNNLRDAVALYLAAGLDPQKSVIFLQSDVQEHAELGYIMACTTYLGELNRMTQFKERVAKNVGGISAGLYTYPCLMAADILLYDADYVPVGEDQTQHVELTRDLALRFNKRYGESFHLCQPLVTKVGKRIMSLNDPTHKMSKSEGNDKGCIYLLDDLKVIRKKIMAAVTDSLAEIQSDQIKQPGIYNLLEIHSSLSGLSHEELVKQFAHQGYGTFKKAVADLVCAEIGKIQREYQRILAADILDEVLKEGADKARKIAAKKMEFIRNQIGIEIKNSTQISE